MYSTQGKYSASLPTSSNIDLVLGTSFPLILAQISTVVLPPPVLIT